MVAFTGETSTKSIERTPFDIFAEILRNCEVRTPETQTSAHNDVDSDKHVSLLLATNLLTLDPSGEYYVTTPKGLVFLRAYDEIKQMQQAIATKKKIIETLLNKEEIISEILVSMEDSLKFANEFLTEALKHLE